MAGPALADNDIFTKGTVGEHHLRDTPENGGVVCRFTSDASPYHLTSFKFRPPVVYAIDFNSKRNKGLVGWRVYLDRYDPAQPEEGAQIFFRSGLQLATAYDDKPAPFRARTFALDLPQDDGVYRAFVKMFWYRADGSVKGASVHVISQYKRVIGEWSEVAYGDCPGTMYE